MKARLLTVLFLAFLPFSRAAAKITVANKNPVPFRETGKMEDFEKASSIAQYNLMAELLAGVTKSDQKQEIIKRFLFVLDGSTQEGILASGFNMAVNAGNMENVDDIVARATQIDRSKTAKLFCNLVAEMDFAGAHAKKPEAKAFFPEGVEKVKELFEAAFPVAQKYQMLNYSCEKYGTLRDLYARYYPDLEKKFAQPTQQAQAIIKKAEQVKPWKCTQKDIFYGLSQALITVQKHDHVNIGKIGIDEGACRLHGVIEKNKSGEITFRTYENLTGFHFEVKKLTSTSKVDVILDAMKKANLLTPEGEPVVPKSESEEAEMAIMNPWGGAKPKRARVSQ